MVLAELLFNENILVQIPKHRVLFLRFLANNQKVRVFNDLRNIQEIPDFSANIFLIAHFMNVFAPALTEI